MTRTSWAGPKSRLLVRNASRIRRFKRLRTVALPTRRLTVMPMRVRPAELGRRIMTKDGKCARAPFRWRARNSARRRNRAAFGNAAAARAAICSSRLFRWNGDRQTLTPLGTAALQYVPATSGRHSRAKSVSPLAPNVAGLKGALHRAVRFKGSMSPQSGRVVNFAAPVVCGAPRR
jgi:hypothetical protein